jgi:peptidyl-prolyl cis-trans isomerase D
MIQLIRKMIDSKLGVGIALAFLLLIAFAFAAGDMSSIGGAGGGTGDKVATVGGQKVTASQVGQSATAALENLKRENPKLSMAAFVAGGGIEKVLDQLLSRLGMAEFGKEHGIIASERLIDSEIAKAPGFRGPDGNFSDAAFQQMLRQQGISEKAVRDDLAQGLISRQLMLPASIGAIFSNAATLQYTALLQERRSGSIGLVPSAVFAPNSPPTDAELQVFYGKNTSKFIRPERRIIRYASFGDAALKALPAPTDAEIAASYQAHKADYAALETRKYTQLIAPTEAAAKAIADEAAKGTPLQKVALAKGLSTAAIGPLSKAELASQASSAVADASFAAGSGTIATPAKGGLGWYVMRVDGIDRRAERTLDQVRSEIAAKITTERRRTALNDLSAKLDDEFSSGGNLAEAAKELGLTLQSTPALTADGHVYGQPDAAVPPALVKVVQAAFAMERENQPQLAEVEAGKTFMIFDVTSITASAPAPLAEVRNDALIMYGLEKGSSGAKAAAEKAFTAAKKGADLGAAFAALGVALPPVDRVELGRQQLTAYKQQVPPPLMLLFSMAKGTSKLLPAPNNRGWYVIALKDIIPGKIDPKDPTIAQAQSELGKIAGSEYSEQLARAISAEVGVTRNDAVVQALRKQLSGGN